MSCTAPGHSPPCSVCSPWQGKPGWGKRWHQGCPEFKACGTPVPRAACSRAPRLPWGEEGDCLEGPILPSDASSRSASPRGAVPTEPGMARGQRTRQVRTGGDGARTLFPLLPLPPHLCNVPAYTLELAQREGSWCQKTSLVQIISLLEP